MAIKIIKINGEEKAVATSYELAKVFDLDHYEMVRGIEAMECSEHFKRQNFIERLNPETKQTTLYITRGGFMLVGGLSERKNMKQIIDCMQQFSTTERLIFEKRLEREKGIAVRQALTKALQQATENTQLN